MEVSSSTTASTLQDNNSHVLPHTLVTSLASTSSPVVSTSGPETEGLNNVVSKEAPAGTLEVRYGPHLPSGIYSSETINSKDVRDSKAVPGVCGLYNLGNTCFMNAGLQSLMSCAPLVKFFCESYNLTDGNKHTLTAQFYILLCKMWSGHFSVVHPRKFKDFLGFYHSQFEDYRQHDCQEFLALLLDTLHEQLNSAATANTHSYLSSPLPVTSSCSALPIPSLEKYGAAAVTTPLKSKPLPVPETVLTGVMDGGLVSDLNNKDSSPTVLSPAFNVDRDDDVNVKSVEYAGLAQAMSGTEVEQSLVYADEGSPTSQSSVLDAVATSPSSHGDVASQKSPERGEEDEIISSSFPPLKRYTSRSNLDDVTSSDSGVVLKPSLKRVSSGSSVLTCPIFHSEDSNHSSVSAHSTDSEQSSAFKRLKIDAIELNKNTNNIVKECVTSSSDCKKNTRSRKNMLNDNNALRATGDILVTSNVSMPSSRIDLNVIDNMVSSCQEALCVDIQSPESEKPEAASQLSPGLPSLDDFYSKETKTLNTNVVSEFLQEITSDSEKFAKLDNRYRPPSKEINILQEAFGEEDKAEKVLIGHRFGSVKKTNLYAQTSVAVVKPVKNSDPNILNNSLDMDVEAMSKFVPSGAEVVVAENTLPLKLFPDNHKLDEVEKNVQMQAYTKFNTIPDRSNIRTDLIDAVPDPDCMEVDEADIESSDEDEIEVASHTSTVDECSSVPNCLRYCSSSEVGMANRAWDEYLAKNDSIIVSTFQGQFRSTVVCSECSHVSVTYEPFMYLSLPIPHAMEQQICVVYISQHKPPVRYLLNLLKTDKIGTAKKKLCELVGQDDSDIIMAEVLDSHISRILDNNMLLKYVNTFNRKIYAFEAVSLESDSALTVDSVSCHHLISSDGSPSHHDFELPSSSRADLPYTSDAQVSNQSFDSINVNSPSSRDTLDCMLSDSETCEPSSRGQESLTSYFCADDDEDGVGECQSTSGRASGKKSWTSGEHSGQNLIWNLDQSSREAASHSDTGHSLASSSSCTVRDNQVNSCTSVFWCGQDTKHSKELTDGNHDQDSEDETIVSEASSSQADLFPNIGHNSRTSVMKGSPDRLEEDEDVLPASIASTSKFSSATNSTAITSTTISVRSSSHQITSSSTNSSADNISRNPSRSCPSPDGVSHTSEHQSTLLDVAARLEEGSGNYFVHRTQSEGNYDFYPEGTCDVADTSGNEAFSDRKSNVDARWSNFPTNNSSASDTRTAHIVTYLADSVADQWRSCAICLEDLLGHGAADSCLMSVKHTADVSAFCCPICLNPANMCEDFVPLASASASKPKIRMLPMSIAYRHSVKDNTGSSTLQLFGHPNIVHMPSVVSGEALYSRIDRLVSPLLTSYSILLTDGQGLTCSRCTYSWHCTGCEIAREGEITLQPSDCLTIHAQDTLSSDQVLDMQFVHEDVSMAGLRSSEPTTIMDCFGAFTQ
ncbi:unnamed protein product, partial [Candidula unifasciata]